MDFGRVDEIWCFIVIYLFELYNVIYFFVYLQ